MAALNLRTSITRPSRWIGTLKQETFYCGTQNQLPQSLTINNCLFEFSGIEIFDCTDEANAIGGWPYGAKLKLPIPISAICSLLINGGGQGFSSARNQ